MQISDRVLVTGASGFIAKHIVLHLVRAGWTVRGTVRNAQAGEAIRHILEREGASGGRFEFAVADLTRDAGWDAALSGCRYVLHTASPFPGRQPRDASVLVTVARGGTLRVLEAAKRQRVERAVVTSSVASIFYGHDIENDRVFGEADFSNVDSPSISPYAVSKTQAERAAWETVLGSNLELATINPSLVLGPTLDDRLGTSAKLLRLIMSGRVLLLPDIRFGIVDVRDVAEAHVRAMQLPAADGRRFIVSAGEKSLSEIADLLARAYPDRSRRISRRRLPTGLIHFAARFSSRAAMLDAEIGRTKKLDTTSARNILGLEFRSSDEAILSLAESLIRFRCI